MIYPDSHVTYYTLLLSKHYWLLCYRWQLAF